MVLLYCLLDPGVAADNSDAILLTIPESLTIFPYTFSLSENF